MLKDIMLIDVREQKALREAAKSVVSEILGGDTVSYRLISRYVYQSLWDGYRRKFSLDSYRNTPARLIDEGMEFVLNWQPPDWVFEASAYVEMQFENYLYKYFDDCYKGGYTELGSLYNDLKDDFIRNVRES